MAGIVEIQLRRLEQRLAAAQDHAGRSTRRAKQWLADEGYDPVFGARPLKRVIQRALQDQLAEMILAGEVKDEDTVPVTAGPDGLIVGHAASPSRSRRERPVAAVVH